jgi:hypothetical protein
LTGSPPIEHLCLQLLQFVLRPDQSLVFKLSLRSLFHPAPFNSLLYFLLVADLNFLVVFSYRSSDCLRMFMRAASSIRSFLSRSYHRRFELLFVLIG